jgi:hypothetical protein
MEVTVDESRSEVLALEINGLPRVVLSEADDPIPEYGHRRAMNLSAENVYHTTVL